MKVALVYDRVNKWGGAERVLLVLHKIFPYAPLYTSVYSKKNAPWVKVFPQVKTTFLQRIPFFRTRHELVPFLMPFAFERLDLSGYDLVISVTSESAKGVIKLGDAKHICYCLTPTRYLWHDYETYFPSKLKRIILSPIIFYLRNWDFMAAQRPDVMIAISTEVQARIKKYYKRDSEIVFPPVEFKKYKVSSIKYKGNNYYLLVSRLVPYKKVDLAIEAFNELGHELLIIGEGKEKNRLQKIAKKNIKFLGKLTEIDLKAYYKGARSLIFPQLEDFGLVSVEAQSCGTPVIAFRGGGTLDTVVGGKTGVFFDKQDKKSLIFAIERFNKIKFDKIEITKNAKRFSEKRFKTDFLKIIRKI